MREAMKALEEEMNATSRIMLRMEEEKKGLDRMLERNLPEIRDTIRGDQRRMRREDEDFLNRRRDERGDYGPIQRPWRESKKEKKKREERMAGKKRRWGAERGTGWGSWDTTGADGWSTKANYEPTRGEGSSKTAEPTEEEWKEWGGKANADADWWNGHYDDES
jgi:hypothetical protein